MRTLTTADWRLTAYAGGADGELYDRNADPEETHNRYRDAAFEPIRRELEAMLFEEVLCACDHANGSRQQPAPPATHWIPRHNRASVAPGQPAETAPPTPTLSRTRRRNSVGSVESPLVAKGSATTCFDAGKLLWQLNHPKTGVHPWFHPLATPSGVEITRNRPWDHPWHRGLWFSWKYVNGVNFWNEDPRTGEPAGRVDLEFTGATPGGYPWRLCRAVPSRRPVADASAGGTTADLRLTWPRRGRQGPAA